MRDEPAACSAQRALPGGQQGRGAPDRDRQSGYPRIYGAHPDEVAKWYADNLKPGMTAEALGSLVFHNHPVGKELVHQIQLSYEHLKLTKVIDPDTDPAETAQRVTVDILSA